MGLKICVLGSGSTGNCIYVSSGTTALLIDNGLPPARVERSLAALGTSADNLSILLTHTHSDHTAGLVGFFKRHGDATVYCHAAALPGLKERDALNTVAFFDGDFFVGDVTVSPFRVSHDVPCYGFRLYHAGKKITLATDLGRLPRGFVSDAADSDLVLLESNHDITLLNNNRAYPPYLKSRILSDRGHLSNAACADAVVSLARAGVGQVILAHLSKENNYPELAFETCKDRLLANGLSEGKDVRLEVALPDRMSGLYEIV